MSPSTKINISILLILICLIASLILLLKLNNSKNPTTTDEIVDVKRSEDQKDQKLSGSNDIKPTSIPNSSSDSVNSENQNIDNEKNDQIAEKFTELRNKIRTWRSDKKHKIEIFRDCLLQDSMREIFLTENNVLQSIIDVEFLCEEGVDVGGLRKEWFSLVIQEALNPINGYFEYTNDNKTTVRPSILSYKKEHNLEFFQFVGKILAMAIINDCNVNARFDFAVYKSILNQAFDFSDLQKFDVEYYNSLKSIRDSPVEKLELNFAYSYSEEGEVKTIELLPGGSKEPVTDENKELFIKLTYETKLFGLIKDQLAALRKGFFEILPEDFLASFSEENLEYLICGKSDIDIEDWKKNTTIEWYESTSPQIIWFWEMVDNFSVKQKKDLLQFVTGSSEVPYEGFSNLQSNGKVFLFTICHSSEEEYNDPDFRLPSSNTCFNILSIPEYSSKEALEQNFQKALEEPQSFEQT